MIRYKPLPNDESEASGMKARGVWISSKRLSVDIGQNPAFILQSEREKVGAIILTDESGAGYYKSISNMLDEAIIKMSSRGCEKESLEGAIVGGSDSAQWKIKKWRDASKANSITPREYDLNGMYYRKIYFEPAAGLLSVYRKEIDKNQCNPASATLSLDDGTRGFSDGQAGGVVANATRFFRQELTFKALRELIVPEHLRLTPKEPFLVWCAACSSGVEAYSYAMYIHRLLTRINAKCSFKVFGTDINAQLIETARAGEYDVDDNNLREYSAYFERYGSLDGDHLRFGDEIRRYLSFNVFDLKKRPRRRDFRVIICANVFQYYHDSARAHFLSNFESAIDRPGYMYVGPVDQKIINQVGLSKLTKYKMLRAD